MKPTDKERREVAKRLRRLAGEQKGVPWFLIEKYLGLVSCEQFVAGSMFTSECVLYLADLIEPAPERTCEPIPRRDESGKPTFNCSECGTAIGGLRGSDKYCHECGAKVMRK